MKKLITALALCVTAFTVERANADSWQNSGSQHDGYVVQENSNHEGYVVHDGGCFQGVSSCFSKSSLELAAGYRTDDLNFRIGSALENQDTFSKVHFDELRIYQFGALFRTNFECLYLRAAASVGQIYSGKSRVTNYGCDCSSTGDVRFHNKTGRGEVWDVCIAAGYPICACDNQFKFIPVIGYSTHEQRIRRFGPIHGFATGATLSDYCGDGSDGDCGDFSSSGDSSFFSSSAAQPSTSIAKSGGCCFSDNSCPSSRLRARWSGPFIGFDWSYEFGCNLDFYGAFEYTWARYNAKGHWNFNDQFVDNFHQRANGDGQTYVFGLNYHWMSSFDVGAVIQFQEWRTRRGSDRSYLSSSADFDSGSTSTSGGACGATETTYNRLREVRWSSFAISGTVGYGF